MRTSQRWLHRAYTLWRALLSLNPICYDMNEIEKTTGLVQGSEFGMLITLANPLHGVRVWLGVFALWMITRPA